MIYILHFFGEPPWWRAKRFDDGHDDEEVQVCFDWLTSDPDPPQMLDYVKAQVAVASPRWLLPDSRNGLWIWTHYEKSFRSCRRSVGLEERSLESRKLLSLNFLMSENSGDEESPIALPTSVSTSQSLRRSRSSSCVSARQTRTH